MTLTPFQGLLAALADGSVSVLLYPVAGFQLAVLGLGCFASVRRTRWYALAAAVSHLLLAALLLAGFYFATRPVG